MKGSQVAIIACGTCINFIINMHSFSLDTCINFFHYSHALVMK